MKTLRYLIIICLIPILFIFGCNENKINKSLATPSNSVVSPSGKYILNVEEGFDGQIHFQTFNIVKNINSKKEVLFKAQETFRTRDKLYFIWDINDSVWVYSGDLGTYYWTNVNEVLWKKHSFSEEKVTPPDFLINEVGVKPL